MIVWLFLLLEFLLIFSTSRYIFQSLFVLVYKLTKSQKVSFTVISVFFFPGTVIHELAHLFAAELLQVKTHGMEFTPEYRDGGLKMGSVKIQQTDPLRSVIIGGAPLLVGVCVITCSLWLFSASYQVQDIVSSPLSFLLAVIFGYLLFVVTNTMFSSKKDLEGVWILMFITMVIVFALYLIGLHPIQKIGHLLTQKLFIEVAWRLVVFISIPLGLNLSVVIIARLLKR